MQKSCYNCGPYPMYLNQQTQVSVQSQHPIKGTQQTTVMVAPQQPAVQGAQTTQIKLIPAGNQTPVSMQVTGGAQIKVAQGTQTHQISVKPQSAQRPQVAATQGQVAMQLQAGMQGQVAMQSAQRPQGQVSNQAIQASIQRAQTGGQVQRPSDLVVLNPSVEDQDSIIFMPTQNLLDPELLAPSRLPSADLSLLTPMQAANSVNYVKTDYCNGPIVVQTRPGADRRLAKDIYIEDALNNPYHVDVPAHAQFDEFQRTWNLWNPFAGGALPQNGLREIYEAKELEKLVQQQRIDDMTGISGAMKHDSVLDLGPGIIPDFRRGPNSHRMDFGGLQPDEIVDGENKTRLYSSYATTPGVGLYETSFQSKFF